MDDRTCASCGKSFPKPTQLRRHQARKTPCAPILEEKDIPAEKLKDPDLNKKQCRFCKRVFSSYDSMRRHVRTSCKIPPNKRNGDAGMELLYEHTIRRQQEQIEELKTQHAEETAAMREQLGQLTAMMQQLVARPPPPPPQQQSATTNHGGEVAVQGDGNEVQVDKSKHQHITINVFGQEQLEHITRAQVGRILEEASSYAVEAGATKAVLEAAMLVYADPEHPENITCYIPNKKMQEALIHRDRGWEVEPVPKVLPPMMQRSVDLLFDRQPLDPEQYDLDAWAKVLKALQQCERDKHKTKQLAGPNGSLRAVLVRNKEQLAQILEKLPAAGQD